MSDDPALALRHHYTPRGTGEDIPLYAGEFRTGDEPEPAHGTVRWQWGRFGRIKMDGERNLKFADPALDFVKATEYKSSSMWIPHSAIEIDAAGGRIPPQPAGSMGAAAGHPSVIKLAGTHRFEATLEQALGDPSKMDRVTFLIPNGWEADDGAFVSDATPQNAEEGVDAAAPYVWPGRTVCGGGGWSVTFDMVGEMRSGTSWRELRDGGGMRFTHVGELRRVDEATFTGDDAFAILDRVRIALNIALGRRVSCALPVGYLQGEPVWTRWRTSPVDRLGASSDWLDRTIAARQIGHLVSRVLDVAFDAGTWSALRSATGYYTAGKDVTVDLSVPLPISGLQALTFFRFMSTPQMSNTKWKNLQTEGQIRLLLEAADIDLAVPAHLIHLESARSKLSQAKKPGDALTAVVEMRNVATHPTDQLPYDRYTIYEWAEGGMVASYWLCLALLKLVDYNIEMARRLEKDVPYVGQVKLPPWAPKAVITPSS